MFRLIIVVCSLLLIVGLFMIDWSWYDNDDDDSGNLRISATISPNTIHLVKLDPLTKTNRFISSDDIKHSHRKCDEKRNIVFVKTHKTGTSTFVNVLYRFGWMRGLNYAIYPYTHQLEYVFEQRLMDNLEESRSPSASSEYNIMCQHMIYRSDVIRHVMPKDTFYFSLLREPTRAFISFFIFYGYDRRVKSASENRSLSLEETIRYHLKTIKLDEHDARFSISHELNSMSFDLGMVGDSGRVVTIKEVNDYVNKLDKDFSFMMLLEYLDESLMLLKDALCWQHDDLLYLNRMQSANKRRSHEELSEDLLRMLKRYLTPDYKIYEHFKKKLLLKISEQETPAFSDNVKAFKAKQKQFEEKCIDKGTTVAAVYHTLSHPLTKFGASNINCSLLHERDTVLTKLLSAMQDGDKARRDQHFKTTLKGKANQFFNLPGEFPRKAHLKVS